MSEDIRVIQYGLGPIGSAIARHIVERAGLDLVGGVDIDPNKVGRDVGDVIGLEGASETARIVSIDLASNTLRLDRSLDWSADQGVALAYDGTRPDIGL